MGPSILPFCYFLKFCIEWLTKWEVRSFICFTTRFNPPFSLYSHVSNNPTSWQLFPHLFCVFGFDIPNKDFRYEFSLQVCTLFFFYFFWKTLKFSEDFKAILNKQICTVVRISEPTKWKIIILFYPSKIMIPLLYLLLYWPFLKTTDIIYISWWVFFLNLLFMSIWILKFRKWHYPIWIINYPRHHKVTYTF